MGVAGGGAAGFPKALLVLPEGGPPGFPNGLIVTEPPTGVGGTAEAAAGWLIGAAGLLAGCSLGLADAGAGTGVPPCRISFNRPMRSGAGPSAGLLEPKVDAPKRLVWARGAGSPKPLGWAGGSLESSALSSNSSTSSSSISSSTSSRSSSSGRAKADFIGDAGTGGLAAKAGVFEGALVDVPKGLAASLPKVRAGGVPLDPAGAAPDENDGRAGLFDAPKPDVLAGEVGDDGLAAGFINSPKRVGGGSCLLGAAGAVDGGGTGERTGAGAALMAAEAVALMVAAAG